MKKFVLFFITISAMLSISAFTYLSSNGIAYETGSPSDNTYCIACHSGGPSAPTLVISASPAFGAGNTYVASATYTINVTCSGSYPKYGFDLEILNTNATTGAADQGTFSALANSQIVPGSQPTNITHIYPTGSGNTATFSFAWKAPASGTAYLYCAAIGANNNNSFTGDNAIKTSMILVQSAAGIASLETNISDITIFPNPASDYLNVKFILPEPSSVNIELFDITGNKAQVLFTEAEMSGEVNKPFDISSHPKGIYFLRVNAGGISSLQRVIKM